MIMTMLGFAGVCANAGPPNASGSNTIALERQLFLIIAHSPFSQAFTAEPSLMTHRNPT
jgi:hypothetical protein